MQGKALFQVRQRLAAIYSSFELCEIVMKWLISDLASVFTLCLVQGLSEIHATETTVADMKARADRAIKDNDYGGEGWAQMVARPNKGFPEIVKQFLKEQFLKGEESASAKVSTCHI